MDIGINSIYFLNSVEDTNKYVYIILVFELAHSNVLLLFL